MLAASKLRSICSAEDVRVKKLQVKTVRMAGWVLVGLVCCGLAGRRSAAQELQPIRHFPLQQDGLALHRPVQAGMPFTVAGEQGVVVGQQEGTFEAWLLPVKLLSHFAIRVEVEGYTVPIELNPDAAQIDVYPDHTTITYSHIAFTVRQTMFAPDQSSSGTGSSNGTGSPDGTGAVVLFQIDSVRPMDLTFSFTPEVRRMWPQMNEGVPSPEWVKQGGSGLYILHMDFPDIAGAVAMPHTQPGVLAPYQEKPQVHPLELKLHYDPKRDGDSYFPLLMAVGTTAETATSAVLQTKIKKLNEDLPKIYRAHAERYRQLLARTTTIETPDAGLNADLRWAEVSIEQLRAKAQPSAETGLVAGYFSSGDSARPGFGWFFGRDALYTLYAVNSYGDFALSRAALKFLMKRQRADGKMMHEYSQTAAYLDWKAFPYMYAAADATPLFLTAVWDYVHASGDVEFVRQHKDEIERAWQFETTHDSDGDGIYDNVQGTGWVESWPTGMPHQEIYLALLDQQASVAMGKLEALLGNTAEADTATHRAAQLASKIEAEYRDAAKHGYAFSRNADGTLDRTVTVYPAIAWWNGGPGLANAGDSLTHWASHDFSTDWGLRDVAESEPFYDPISYHQGSVWPLFTGWTSIAEYRAGRPLAGYQHLMQTADMTTTQDLGAVTELLSGAFFQPFGRSTSHQLWSSAMVITPLMRGLFGLDVDALKGTVSVAPHLPAEWDKAAVRGLHVGQAICDIEYARQGGQMRVSIKTTSGPPIKVAENFEGEIAKRAVGDGVAVFFAMPAFEVGVPHGLPSPGARTAQLKVLSQEATASSLTLRLEAQGGAVYKLPLRRNDGKATLHVTGAEAKGDQLIVHFPAGDGYQPQLVTLRW